MRYVLPILALFAGFVANLDYSMIVRARRDLDLVEKYRIEFWMSIAIAVGCLGCAVVVTAFE